MVTIIEIGVGGATGVPVEVEIVCKNLMFFHWGDGGRLVGLDNVGGTSPEI